MAQLVERRCRRLRVSEFQWRNRSLEETTLWHDGEAAAAKEAFRTLPSADRAAIIRFLKSL